MEGQGGSPWCTAEGLHLRCNQLPRGAILGGAYVPPHTSHVLHNIEVLPLAANGAACYLQFGHAQLTGNLYYIDLLALPPEAVQMFRKGGCVRENKLHGEYPMGSQDEGVKFVPPYLT